MSLVKDSSAGIEKALRVVEGELVIARKRLAALEKQQFEEAAEFEKPSKATGRNVIKAEHEVDALQSKVEDLKAELAAENGIGWTEFLRRLDLVSYEGRAKANALCKRLGVIVMVGASGYGVTKNGQPLLGMDFRDGEAGYLMPGFGGALPTFLPVSEVPAYADAEDADQARYDSLPDDGTPLLDIEAGLGQDWPTTD
ncbi:hypothetical protein AU476_09210 [Cupriavidus sp. UYMSc13B]|nr:hypothetical protein AU476_09210 [Cupriavidus sp. UYMSc13B]